MARNAFAVWKRILYSALLLKFNALRSEVATYVWLWSFMMDAVFGGACAELMSLICYRIFVVVYVLR